MRAYDLSLIVLCLCVGASIISNTGLIAEFTGNTDYAPTIKGVNFSEPPEPASVASVAGQQDITNMTQITSSSATSSSDITNNLSGWGLLVSVVYTLVNFFGYLFVPAYYLYHIGAPLSFAVGINVLFNAIEVIGVLQFLSGRMIPWQA